MCTPGSSELARWSRCATLALAHLIFATLASAQQVDGAEPAPPPAAEAPATSLQVAPPAVEDPAPVDEVVLEAKLGAPPPDTAAGEPDAVTAAPLASSPPSSPAAPVAPDSAGAEVAAPAYRLFPLAGTFEIGYGTLGVADAVRREEGVGRGHYLVLGAGLIVYEVLALTVDLGGGGHRDTSPFTQTTTSMSGEGEYDSKSSVAGWFVSSAAGLRTPRLFLHEQLALTAGAQVGTTAVRVKRSISDCVDCREDKYRLASGPFWQALIAVGAGQRENLDAGFRLVGVGVTYRRPIEIDDVGSSLFVTLGFY